MMKHIIGFTEYAVHAFPPVWDTSSRILILGSFPSVKSREASFYYAHKQNRFWKVLANIFAEPIPIDVPCKKNFLLRHKIALWDVVASCDIQGSSDSTIENAVGNDISVILKGANIQMIFTNGKTARDLFYKLIWPSVHLDAICLPSTSPANAAWGFEALCDSWKIIRQREE